MNAQLVKKDPMQVAIRTRQFSPESSQKEIPLFWRDYMLEGSHAKVPGMMGICLPCSPEGRLFTYGIGCEARWLKEVPENFRVVEIPGGTWAIFECRGKMPGAIQSLWQKIHAEWLPRTEHRLKPGYEIEFYHEGDPGSDDYRSEIWLPVQDAH